MKGKWLTAALAVVLAGCGGGGGSSSSPVEQGTEFAFGNLSGRAAATNPPLTSNSNDVTATALKGTITALRLRDQQIATDELRILFQSTLGVTTGNYDLLSTNLAGTELVRITDTPGISEDLPAVSADGKRVAFQATGTGGDQEIFVVNMDGTGRVQLTNNDFFDSAPRWHPSGNGLVYFTDEGDINFINVNTKIVTPLVPAPTFGAFPDFSADGQKVVFQANNLFGTTGSQLWSVPTVGGPISEFFTSGGAKRFVRLSPDGLSASYFADGTPGQQLFTIGGNVVAGVPADVLVGWAPDSRRVVYSGPGQRLFVADPNGANVLEVLAQHNVPKAFPSFIPAPKDVLFVGSGSLFGSRLAGMIFSQQGSSVRGLLGFDADTPSTVVLTKQTPDNTTGPNIVFSVDADSVREISYAHAPYWKPVRVVGNGTPVPSAAGALVSLDSVSGKVVAVLPFSGSRSGKPSFKDDGGTRVFTGSFLGVFDSEGKNLGAASEARLNTATGELTVS